MLGVNLPKSQGEVDKTMLIVYISLLFFSLLFFSL
nr:MAG TPA: hypothetical protein [Caudoviricetes sp.]